ncbi:MAG: HD-GYP domain-containing protein [Lachnospiraceae bacterium]|nr:HD-GYP domain-containing protein [Lachnospiraceae bacterium]
MFFTNGGVEGGTPIWLLLGTIYISLILEGRLKVIMLISEAVVLIACWIIGYCFPELITQYSREGNYFDTIAGLFIVSGIIFGIISFQNRLYRREEEQKNVQRLFAQTATALVNAIDAKDKYTHGHSARVAEYSRKIAEWAAKTPSECEEIYYVALLHDVGKIGIPEAIINKEGKLTDEEFSIIKQHSFLGAQILQSITEYPYLSIGAHFHHERYDGRGYPNRLKGTDIPEIARIISVADAYDAMTSKRSYRDPIPQEKVREQFIEGAGTQFDPEFANIMLHLIDLDTEYEMKERGESSEFAGQEELIIGEHRDGVSEGILLTPNMTVVRLKVGVDKNAAGHTPKPSIIMFDSLDGRFHDDEKEIKDLLYDEYAEIWLEGRVTNSSVRKTEIKTFGKTASAMAPGEYRIEAVKRRDHALVRIESRDKTVEIIMALPDSSRYVYMGLTGEHCRFSDLKIEKSEDAVPEDYIPRIAKEISYIDAPEGDIPNVQVDGYRTASTKGIPITDGMKITFHTLSLPTARLVWHCPSYVVFSADDGIVSGEDYKEFSLVRLDGETWEGENLAENELIVDRQHFDGWDAWKKLNLQGYDVSVSFSRDGNRIVSTTDNGGVSIRNITTVKVDTGEIYVALSGDQCALTNIRISK